MDTKVIYDEMRRLDQVSGMEISKYPVRISQRMTTTYARCDLRRRNGDWSVTGFVFSAKLMEQGTMEHILDVIRHEYAHAYVTLVHNKDCGHNAAWKRAALWFGCNGEVTEDYDEILTGEAADKYIVTCDHCGAKYRYQRKSKFVKALEQDPDSRRFCCGRCGNSHFSLKVVS